MSVRITRGLFWLWLGVFATGGNVWEQPRTPVLEVVPGTTGLSAASCGQCHTEIYAEWRASTHAAAWTDPQFQGEIDKDPAVAWMCRNCHTPLANQQPRRVTQPGVVRGPRTVANPAFDEALQDEGITCLSCHWRPEGLAGPHPDVQAPHPVVYEPDFRGTELCTSCHQAVATLEDALVCNFNTGAEWESANEAQTCTSCHMPTVHRAAAPGAPVREGGRHLWLGGLPPKGAVTESVQAFVEAAQPGYAVTIDAPATATPGAPVRVEARLTHQGAGHRVPTGDPERHLMVAVGVIAADGTVLGAGEYRIGQQWVWQPVAHKRGDNRLSPGETRSYPLTFDMPDQPVTVSMAVTHVRISEDNHRYHIGLAQEQGKSGLADALRQYTTQAPGAAAQVDVLPR